MECKEFENHIHDYFTDPDFDWRLRDEIDAHYFACDNCFETYQVAKLMADPDIRKGAANKLADIQLKKAEKLLNENRPEEAKKCFEEALELRPGDEEIKGKLSELLEDTTPGSTEIPDDLKSLLDNISILKPMNLLRGNVTLSQDALMGERSFSAERGVDEEKIYMLGERISIDLEPSKDGYLTILLYDDEKNVKLLFPENATDDTFVKGGEKKQFGIVAAEPLCKQYLKVFWTSDQLMVPDQIYFGDDSAIRSAIETFLSSVSALSDDDWMVFVQEFDVVKE